MKLDLKKSQVIIIISGTGLKRFEATLHFRELNHEALKQTPHSIDKFLSLHEDILADKVRKNQEFKCLLNTVEIISTLF